MLLASPFLVQACFWC